MALQKKLIRNLLERRFRIAELDMEMDLVIYVTWKHIAHFMGEIVAYQNRVEFIQIINATI